jgi:hypothetical protein
MATSRKPKGIKVQSANVQLDRNGLTLEMQGVPADQVEAVAQHMLDAVRSLTKRGYGELIVDGGSLHAGALGEVAPDAEYEEAKKRVGFHAT